MDRIKKFIKNKPSKNHRIIEYNNKEYKITKKDIQCIRQYKQNKCLTTLDLYMPLNTAFSRETKTDSLNVKVNKHDNRRQLANYLARIKNYKKQEPKNVNETTDLWDDVLDAKHGVSISLKPIECKYKEIKVDEKAFVQSIEDQYFREPVYVHKIENILPQMPRKKMSDTVSELCIYYKFEENIKYFSINNTRDKFCVVFNQKCEIYEFANQRLINQFFVDSKICKALCCEKYTIIAYGKFITILYYEEQDFETKENKFVNIKHEKQHITIEHKDSVKDITTKNNLLCAVAGKSILIHNINNYQTVQPVKLKTELPLKVKFRNNELLITTCNTFYIYNLKGKCFDVKLSALFTFPHAMGFTGDYIFIIDKETRLTILKDNKLIKMIEQPEKIVNIVVHKILNQFVLLFKEKYIIFGYDEYGCKLLKSVDVKTKKLVYHESLNWIYLMNKNQIQVYT